jgi:hypothetical protein
MSNITKHQPALLPDSATHDHRMEICSESSSRKYIVARKSSTGEFQCSCPGWIHHRRCKHLDAMIPVLEATIANEKKQLK